MATDGLQCGAAAFQNVPSPLQSFVENAADFLVDFAGCLLAVILRSGRLEGGDQERISVRIAEIDSAELTHPEIHDHAAADFGGSLKVVLSAAGDVVERHFFGDGAA